MSGTRTGDTLGLRPKEVTMSATITEPARAHAAPRFEDARVHDAMRMGVLTCPAHASLADVARTMATHRIHCVVVADVDRGGRDAWGIVSDFDLALAIGPDAAERSAREIARTELVTVLPDDSLAHAAQLMAEHECTHLVVVDPENRQPIGVLSTLDLAGVLAWGGST
jgi:CBS domain-containing protein